MFCEIGCYRRFSQLNDQVLLTLINRSLDYSQLWNITSPVRHELFFFFFTSGLFLPVAPLFAVTYSGPDIAHNTILDGRPDLLRHAVKRFAVGSFPSYYSLQGTTRSHTWSYHAWFFWTTSVEGRIWAKSRQCHTCILICLPCRLKLFAFYPSQHICDFNFSCRMLLATYEYWLQDIYSPMWDNDGVGFVFLPAAKIPWSTYKNYSNIWSAARWIH